MDDNKLIKYISFSLAIYSCIYIIIFTYSPFLYSQTAQPGYIKDSRDEFELIHLNKSRDNINKLLEFDHKEFDVLVPRTIISDYIDLFRSYNLKLEADTGLKFGMAYTSVYQNANQSGRSKSYSSGDYDLFGRWSLFGDSELRSDIGFRVESRHKYNTDAPNKLRRDYNLASNTVFGFDSASTSIVELWLNQEIINNKLSFRVGKIDFFDIMNSYAFDSSNFYFLNNVFSGHPVTSEPDNGLGAIFRYVFENNYYFFAGIMDANAENNTSGFSTFFDEREYLSAIEFGYKSDAHYHYSDNYHVFLWYSDGRDKKNIKSDAGVSLILQKTFNNIIPFINLSLNRGRANEIEELYSTGVVINNLFGYGFNSLGIAGAIGNSSEAHIKKEYIAEAYYKIRLFPYVELSPDVQFLRTKVSNGKYRNTKVYGLRFRISS